MSWLCAYQAAIADVISDVLLQVVHVYTFCSDLTCNFAFQVF